MWPEKVWNEGRDIQNNNNNNSADVDRKNLWFLENHLFILTDIFIGYMGAYTCQK